MAEEWYVRYDASEVGPLRPKELLELVRSGSVTPATMLRKGDSAWFPAEEVGGLFDAARRPTLSFSCPHCGRPVRKPPCYCSRCERHLDYARPKVERNHVPGDSPEAAAPSQSLGGESPAWTKWLKKLRSTESPEG